METTDGTTCDGYEETRENCLSLNSYRWPHVLQAIPKLRYMRPFDQESYHQGEGHEQERKCENRIYPAYNLVNGQKSGYDVVDEHHDDPEHDGKQIPVIADGGDVSQDDCRRIDKDGSYEEQKDEGEDQHDLLCGFPKIRSDQFRESGPVMAKGNHSRKIIMDSSRENAAEDYPQISRRPEFGTHDGPEDRTCPGDVEELDHIDLPQRHGDKIHPVRMHHGRCRPRRFGREYLLH